MKINRKHIIIRSSAVFITVTAIIAGCFLVDFSVISDRLKSIGYEPTSEMTEFRNSLSLTQRADVIFSASHPSVKNREDFNASCGSENPEISILGCYASERIYIYNIDNPELAGIKESTLAHELLHAAWDRLTKPEQDNLTSELDQAYAANLEILEPRLALYSDEDFYDELHSIIGTEYADLSEILESHYAKYFEDQDNVVTFYDNYNVKFQELRAESEALYAQITSNQTLIDAKTTNYNDAVIELNAAIVDFNRRAENGYFTSQSAFDAERATLIAKQHQLDNLYHEINDLIETTNSLIADYNSNIARTEVLLNSINSNAAETPEIE